MSSADLKVDIPVLFHFQQPAPFEDVVNQSRYLTRIAGLKIKISSTRWFIQ
jgi:hypothetical protein